MRNPLEAVPVTVAVVTNSDSRGERLKDLLQASGVEVQLYSDAGEELVRRIATTPAAAVVVDLDGAPGGGHAALDALVRQDTLPVLFNDGTALGGAPGATDRELGARIREKVYALIEARAHDRGTARRGAPELSALDGADAETAPGHGQYASPAEGSGGDVEDLRPARHVWVLGASLGGPDAVKRFISALPAGLPVAFVLAQRIGMDCIPLLMAQLRRVTDMKVMLGRVGHVLQHGQLIVAPVDRLIAFDRDGRMQPVGDGDGDAEAPASIDGVMAAVAARFGHRAGAIVLSGIGNDGVMGARSILEQGGTVWAQAADSCIMSSMPDHVRNACPVELNASPEVLAARLVRQLGERAAYAGAAPQVQPVAGDAAGE